MNVPGSRAPAPPGRRWSPAGRPEMWSALPFALLLLAIAVLPLLAEKFWHHNRNKALVVAALSLPVALYLLLTGPDVGAVANPDEPTAPTVQTTAAHPGTHALLHGVS